MIELLLSYALSRKDVKPLAKNLLKNFKGIRGLLDTNPTVLEKVEGLGEHSALIFSLVKDLTIKYFEPNLESKLTLSSPDLVYRLMFFISSKQYIGLKQFIHQLIRELKTSEPEKN